MGCRCAALTAFNGLNGPEPVKAGDTVLVLGTGGVATYVSPAYIFHSLHVIYLFLVNADT